MSCCTGRGATPPPAAASGPRELDPFAARAREIAPGISRIEFVVPDIHCPACITRIERTLAAHAAVTTARVNMTTRRVAIEWHHAGAGAGEFVELLAGLGYAAHPFAADAGALDHDAERGRELLIALAVAGFAAANVMLLSVSVWSGADAATRDLFHWVSALIALPAIAFAGRPFFASAWTALRARRLNMDVPISLGVILAGAMSLYETIHQGAEAYFDAAVMLLFFLLVGRTLDHMMRARARDAVSQLMRLAARSASLVGDDGTARSIPIDELCAGMVVRVAPGERIPVDGVVLRGVSEVDRSMLTGESFPDAVRAGDMVHEGTENLTGTIDLRVEACGRTTLLAEIVRTMEAAEGHKAGYVRLADAAARLYAPVVHVAALATFLGWLWVSGGDWHVATFTAIAVLIITCPCALGLAVPVVQVVASGVLFRNGIMVKGGDALERLAQIDTAVFDKTGTLTLGRPGLVSPAIIDVAALGVAAGLAAASRHPLSRAIVALAAARGVEPAVLADVAEHPGKGLEGRLGRKAVKLGSRAWCGAASEGDDAAELDGRLEMWLRVGTDRPLAFRFEDAPRRDAAGILAELAGRGIALEMLSGDRPAAVEHMARLLGVERHRSETDPGEKVMHVRSLALEGRRVLMVGDGINDAPALAAGFTSMAPSSAADVGRTAADFVFFGETLAPVAFAHRIALRARRLVLQNFAFAAAYNAVAVPIAVLGYASPLVAAIAMSSSSIIVCANAMRLRVGTGPFLAWRADRRRDSASDQGGKQTRKDAA